MRDTPKSLVALLTDLVDYAGLFPPAGLSMGQAVERYASYRQGPRAWALGRFIVPAARLHDFANTLSALPASRRGGPPWRLSVLVDPPLRPALESVRAFGRELTLSGDPLAGEAGTAAPAQIEAVEGKVTSGDDLRVLAEVMDAFEVFAEMPLSPVPDALLRVAGDVGCAAKVRTGGTTPEAFPASSALSAFLAGCDGHGVPFKATAGLHHPLRAPHPVTYEPGAPRAVMHGFLNVFLAAALLHAGVIDRLQTEALLDETDASAFTFDDEQAGWRGYRASTSVLSTARTFSRCFGSCSFEEPIDDLTRLALLHTTTS